MSTALTMYSADGDLIAEWHTRNDTGKGFGIGDLDDSPRLAIGSAAGWDWLRYISPDGSCLATDGDGNLVVVMDANGP